jgi:hypothetical protein
LGFNARNGAYPLWRGLPHNQYKATRLSGLRTSYLILYKKSQKRANAIYFENKA